MLLTGESQNLKNETLHDIIIRENLNIPLYRAFLFSSPCQEKDVYIKSSLIKGEGTSFLEHGRIYFLIFIIRFG